MFKERKLFEELDLLETNDPAILEDLSYSSHATIKLSVASNEFTARETLLHMAKTEKSMAILQAILDNPSSDAEIRAIIATNGNKLISLSLSEEKAIHSDLVSGTTSQIVLLRIASTTDDESLSVTLWDKGNFFVKSTLLKRFPNLCEIGLRDSNPFIRNLAKKYHK